MTKRNTINCFLSDAGRPAIPRTNAAEWRIACAEAIKSGAQIFELRTKSAYTPWDGRINSGRA
jgi:hypothetical protein